MKSSRLLPLIVACALFIENMDSTVISTSLPAIARDLATDPIALKLALTTYLLALAVFIPVSGWVADRFGARPTFMTAIGVFLLGSIGCAASDSLEAMVAARFLQGMGGAMMVPVGRLVLLRTVPKNELVQALSWLTIPALVGPVVGPPLGGFITTYFDWRWIFLINIPMGVLGIVLARRFIPDMREPTAPLDWRGFMLAGVGLALAMFGFSTLGRHLVSMPLAMGALVLGTAMLVAYVRHARRHAHPLARPRIVPVADLPRRRARRFAVPHRHRRDAFPVAADVATRLRPQPGAVGPADVRVRNRRDVHEDDRGAHPQALRIPARAGGQRPDRVADVVRLRIVPAGDAARLHHRRPCWSAAVSARCSSRA